MIVWVTLLALATYRVTKVVTTDVATSRLRTLAILRVNRPLFTLMLMCDWCVGWWIAGGAVFACWPVWHPRWAVAVAWPAVAGAAGFLHSVEGSHA